MNVMVNGDEINTRCGTLAALLEQMDYESASVATAVEGEFIAIQSRGQCVLKDNMKIDVVAPMQGG